MIRIGYLNESKNDSEYMRLKRAYHNYKEFTDKDKQSGMILDFTDDLDHKGIPYEQYDNKTDNGCTIFYDNYKPSKTSKKRDYLQ